MIAALGGGTAVLTAGTAALGIVGRGALPHVLSAVCGLGAAAEGVENVSFEKGDAVHLDFPDGSFDAVTSNYVYHNIVGYDRKELLLETLRVLKKGGVFAIHDLMSIS